MIAWLRRLYEWAGDRHGDFSGSWWRQYDRQVEQRVEFHGVRWRWDVLQRRARMRRAEARGLRGLEKAS